MKPNHSERRFLMSKKCFTYLKECAIHTGDFLNDLHN